MLLGEAVQRLRQGIDGGDRRLAIHAAPGAGKTAVLAALAESLRGSRPVVRIELSDDDDAAQAALVQAAAQLAFAKPDLLDCVVPRHEPARVPWTARIAALREGLALAGQEPVIVVDEPIFDPGSSPERQFFAGRAVEITRAVMGAPGVVVLAGSSIPPGIAWDAGVELPLVHAADDAVARGVLAEVSGKRPLPPVIVQVLAALQAGGVDVRGIPRRDMRLDRLVRHDLGRLLLERPSMRGVIARLSALRLPFPEDLPVRAGLFGLPEPDRRIVDHLLAAAGEGRRVVPAALATTIRDCIATGDPAWTPEEPAGDQHRFAAEHHRSCFEAARVSGDVAAAVREELEEIHQLTEAGDAAALLDRSLQFVEQYDALGKSLSQRALRGPRAEEERLRRDAVRAYERAVEHDPRDAYAHHYIAYNLDILATERERVGQEYVTAKDLAPGHPWYHSRHICFLITTSWMRLAREGWERAVADLASTGGPLDEALCEALHRPVARLLLERSELGFAREVLEDAPETVRSAPWWVALDQLRVCLEEDRDQRLVFPPTLPVAERWRGPHLASSGPGDAEIKDWKPGRVLGGDDDLVMIDVASLDAPISTIEIDVRALTEAWDVAPGELRPGAFVELVEYEDGTKEMNVWDRSSSSFRGIANLPKLFPAVDRYLRRAFA